MNTHHQKYLVLAIILVSFFLLGPEGPCPLWSLSGLEWDVNINNKHEGCSEGKVTTFEGTTSYSNIKDGDDACFIVWQKGDCKSMKIDTQTYMKNDRICVEKVGEDMAVTVTFYGDCSGKYLLVPSEECQVDEETPGESEPDGAGGGTPVITDGEPENPLPEDEVYPPEPEPELEPIGTACWASGAACSPVFSTDSRCCSRYCADGACN